jgi:hypothetical protein
MAADVLNSNCYGFPADAYAFGVLMYPYPCHSGTGRILERIAERVVKMDLPPRPAWVSPGHASQSLACLDAHPAWRPSFGLVSEDALAGLSGAARFDRTPACVHISLREVCERAGDAAADGLDADEPRHRSDRVSAGHATRQTHSGEMLELDRGPVMDQKRRSTNVLDK